MADLYFLLKKLSLLTNFLTHLSHGIKRNHVIESGLRRLELPAVLMMETAIKQLLSDSL
jgi:hypothetical protein